MVNQRTPKDLPAPWFNSQKKTATVTAPKTKPAEVCPRQGSNENSVRGEGRRRGRPPRKSFPKGVTQSKGMKKTKSLGASALNILSAVLESSVANVEELCRKRKEDAEACGRVVRTISPIPKQKNTSEAGTPNFIEKDCGNNSGAGGSTGGPQSSPNPCQPSSSRDNRRVEEGNPTTLADNARDVGEVLFSQRLGKEAVRYDVDDSVTKVSRNPHLPSSRERKEHESREIESDLGRSNGKQRGGGRGRRRFRVRNLSEELFEVKEIDLTNSMDEGRGLYGRRYDVAFSRSSSKPSDMARQSGEFSNRQRSPSRSPLTKGRGRVSSSDHSLRDYYGHPYSGDSTEEYWRHKGFGSGGQRHRRQESSSSPERCRRHRKAVSGERFRTHQRRGTTLSCTSPPKKSSVYKDEMEEDMYNSAYVKQDNFVEASTACDRRRRRRRQALLEVESARRERSGSKAFYLMLDWEGRPYGPGKPSWIAEINKLAIGLDPLCTHIKKQTFEDVQTFRNRLDNIFEYSGKLNEDYLRALMGKAVTKRRSELISLIKNNGAQPVHVDLEVWRRLQSLATSKQREAKSEQGHHANACRRTVGRTGSRGVDGVREKLRCLFGRSPDPSKVEEEMHRDKGYGGRKRNKPSFSLKKENKAIEDSFYDEGSPQSRAEKYSPQCPTDAATSELEEGYMEFYLQRKRRDVVYDPPGVDAVGRVGSQGQRHLADTQTKEMSTDDYIKKLKNEIKLLQEEKAKSSNSNGSNGGF